MRNEFKFLNSLFGLSSSREVDQAARRTESKTQQPLSKDADVRIQNYLNRFRELVNREDGDDRSQGLEALKRWLQREFVVKAENIPGSYDSAAVLEAQKRSLDAWITYFSSREVVEHYPDWFLYWVFRSMLAMGKFRSEKSSFEKRDQPHSTLAPFPDLNQEALSFVLGAMKLKMANADKRQMEQGISFRDDVSLADRKRFFDLLMQGKPSFSLLYAWSLEHIKVTPETLLENINGEWREYRGTQDTSRLVNDIKNHGTGWCIRDTSMAQSYLKSNVMSVYFSENQQGKAEIPRLVIVQSPEGHVSEIRGIGPGENLDPFIGPKVKEALLQDEFADETNFQQKIDSVMHLQSIERKIQAGQVLHREDLVALYELDQPFEGFGYSKDPRIAQLRATRDARKDAPVVFGCRESEIAWDARSLTRSTRAYIGPIEPAVLQHLGHLEYIYTSFPEGKISQERVLLQESSNTVRGKLERIGAYITSVAQEMLPQLHFDRKGETVDLIRLQVKDLGFTSPPTTDDIFRRAAELGLELCPAEVGPEYLIQKSQKMTVGEWFYVAMKPILVAGVPRVFGLGQGTCGAVAQQLVG